ncbi:hypothetical protein MTR_0054s0120 [Medicago truncatula]|uniref:Uncharacterized protein n=1 Tax=Medicago truncatula TaxID=3880 RepID=A0A072TJG7_MEDTR|nr:hypothetical protein MTR_0054s0120 [Medicago truncatula]
MKDKRTKHIEHRWCDETNLMKKKRKRKRTDRERTLLKVERRGTAPILSFFIITIPTNRVHLQMRHKKFILSVILKLFNHLSQIDEGDEGFRWRR